MALLRRRDVPILHFEDIPLYEDDLGDNGESMVRLRLRVMPTVSCPLSIQGPLGDHPCPQSSHRPPNASC